MRDALRARVDCSLADLAAAADGSWVTVGGLVTERKKVRTKRGDEMMFATLDDLEGQVELLVFNSAYAATASRIEIDRVVLVRGRVDHKERGETKLVVQEAEAFEPTAAERTGTRPDPAGVDDGPLVLQIDAADFPPTLFEEPARCSPTSRASARCSKMRTRAGTRELRLGREYRWPPPMGCAPSSTRCSARTRSRPSFPYHKRAASTTFRPPFTAVTRSRVAPTLRAWP